MNKQEVTNGLERFISESGSPLDPFRILVALRARDLGLFSGLLEFDVDHRTASQTAKEVASCARDMKQIASDFDVIPQDDAKRKLSGEVKFGLFGEGQYKKRFVFKGVHPLEVRDLCNDFLRRQLASGDLTRTRTMKNEAALVAADVVD